MKQSKCDLMTDCEISTGRWSAVYKADCGKLNSAPIAKKPTTTKITSPVTAGENLTDCVFNDAWGKSHDFGQVTNDYCQEQLKIWNTRTAVPTLTIEPVATPDYSAKNADCKSAAHGRYEAAVIKWHNEWGDSPTAELLIGNEQQFLDQGLANCDQMYPVK